MGYETKLIVAQKFDGGFMDKIAEMNLSKMPNEFFVHNVFTKEIEEPIYSGWGDEEITTDCYGKRITYAPVKDVIDLLKKCEKKEPYRRTKLAINCLKSFITDDWKGCEIVVLNYGY